MRQPRQTEPPSTDGITEARDTSNEQFGEERLAHALSTLGQKHSAQDVVDTLTRAVRTFTSGITIDDDQAVLVLTAAPAASATSPL
ncbi:SpoIIE family protein phosphatase [Streptomyces sp. NPDC048489]|uniref:SpoIIE family protein phosphatase n=1 Tax=Streptomyces sp. NPDC048489 TaxID=3154504 RepID=UPI0034270B0B